MFFALLGRDEVLDMIAEEDDAYLIIVLNGGESQSGCHLGYEVFLESASGAELTRPRDVDEQDNGVFSLLFKDFDEGLVHASGDVPIDVADVVAELIFTHFAESHASTFEGRVILTSKDVIGETTSFDLNLPDTFEEFGALCAVGYMIGVLHSEKRCDEKSAIKSGV